MAHALGRIVALPEDAQQLLVAGLAGIEYRAHRFRMTRPAGTDLLVGRIRCVASDVANRAADDAGRLPELPFRAPETTHRYQDHLETVERAIQWLVRDEMSSRDRHPLGSAREGLCGAGYSQILAEESHPAPPIDLSRRIAPKEIV